MHVRSLGQEDPLEEGTATYSSVPAWRIPWTEEPGRLQSIVSQRVVHNCVMFHKCMSLYTIRWGQGLSDLLCG